MQENKLASHIYLLDPLLTESHPLFYKYFLKIECVIALVKISKWKSLPISKNILYSSLVEYYALQASEKLC